MKKLLTLIALATITAHAATNDLVYLQKTASGKTVERVVTLTPSTFLAIDSGGQIQVQSSSAFLTAIGGATAAQGAKADTALQSGTAISTVSGLQTALDAKQALSGKNQPNGYAGLNASGNLDVSDIELRHDTAAAIGAVVLGNGTLSIITDSTPKALRIGDGVTFGGHSLFGTNSGFLLNDGAGGVTSGWSVVASAIGSSGQGITIAGGTGDTFNQAPASGGSLTLQGGYATGGSMDFGVTGGPVTITGGSISSSWPGFVAGAVNIAGGSVPNAGGYAGDVNIAGGDSASNGVSGRVNISGGGGNQSPICGDVTISGGSAADTGTVAGKVIITGGNSTYEASGDVIIAGGNTTYGASGNVIIAGGNSTTGPGVVRINSELVHTGTAFSLGNGTLTGSSGNVTATGLTTITPATAGSEALNIQCLADQSSNVFQIKNSASAVVLWFNPSVNGNAGMLGAAYVSVNGLSANSISPREAYVNLDLGTITAYDVTLKTSNLERMRITAAGNVEIGSGNVTMNGTVNTAPNQTAASGSSLMTRDLMDVRAPVRMNCNVEAGQTAANAAPFYGSSSHPATAVIPFVPTKLKVRGVIAFTSTPVAYGTGNFTVYAGARNFDVGNLNDTSGNSATLTTTAVTKLAAGDYFLIEAETTSIPAAWSTAVSNYGMLGVTFNSEIINNTGGSLTTGPGSGGWFVLEITR
jgi:hypothetical protein